MRTHRLVTAAVAAVTLVLAGCAESPDDRGDSRPETMRLYGTDGIMQDAFGNELADRKVLRGMKGTAPGNPLPSEFTNRLLEIDGSLEGFLFAGETYDAVVIAALAAELAGTPDPEVVRGYINGVTAGGQECSAVADCLELARDGADLAYRGMSLTRGGFTDLGEPAAASYATLHFGPQGVIDQDRTEYVGASDLSTTTDAPPPEPGARPDPPEAEPLKLGGLLPQTGGLSFAYPPLHAGVRLALEEINEAGGVFGVDVEWVDGDDGTDPEVARETLQSHVEENVHIVIGAAASGVTAAILPDAVEAGVVLFSPSNTAAELADADPEGYYFRTAPSDLLQGAALADIILRDGIQRVVIVARGDAYGLGLQDNARESLLRFGMPDDDVVLLEYGVPEEDGAPVPELDRLVDQIVDARAEGIVLIGFSEASQVIQEMVDRELLASP